MNNKIRVIVKRAGKLAEVRWIENKLEVYNKIVGGYIETFGLTDEILIVLNEEGKIMRLEPNLLIPCHGGAREYIVGDVVFVSIDGAEFAGLSDEQISFIESIGIEVCDATKQ